MNFTKFVYPGPRIAGTTDSPTEEDVEGFRLMHSLKINDTIPFSMYRSVRTGLTICIADVEDPTVNCHFALGNFSTRVDDNNIMSMVEFSLSRSDRQTA